MPAMTCPRCGRRVVYKSEMAGKTGKCRCGESIEAPAQGEDRPDIPMAPVSEPHDRPAMKACDDCGVLISRHATRCPYCGWEAWRWWRVIQDWIMAAVAIHFAYRGIDLSNMAGRLLENARSALHEQTAMTVLVASGVAWLTSIICFAALFIRRGWPMFRGYSPPAWWRDLRRTMTTHIGDWWRAGR